MLISVSVCVPIPAYLYICFASAENKRNCWPSSLFFCSLLCFKALNWQYQYFNHHWSSSSCSFVTLWKWPSQGCCLLSESGDGWQDVRQSQLCLMRCAATRAPESCQTAQRASIWPENIQYAALNNNTYWVEICTTSLGTPSDHGWKYWFFWTNKKEYFWFLILGLHQCWLPHRDSQPLCLHNPLPLLKMHIRICWFWLITEYPVAKYR